MQLHYKFTGYKDAQIAAMLNLNPEHELRCEWNIKPPDSWWYRDQRSVLLRHPDTSGNFLLNGTHINKMAIILILSYISRAGANVFCDEYQCPNVYRGPQIPDEFYLFFANILCVLCSSVGSPLPWHVTPAQCLPDRWRVMTWRLRGSDSKQSIQHLRYWIIDRSNLNWLGPTHTESHHQSNW